MAYSDHPVLGASVVKKSDAYRVMRDPEAMSRSKGSTANRLEVSAPAKLGQTSQTVQIVEAKNGKKYLVSIKAEPVPPCKHASKRKCERDLRAVVAEGQKTANSEDDADSKVASKSRRKAKSGAHDGHKPAQVAEVEHAKTKKHEVEAPAPHRSSHGKRARDDRDDDEPKAHPKSPSAKHHKKHR